ncbi:MAG: hypothetical protein FWE22_03225 [Firmicutes bacterium]|nr:hypothetical protein [Bacillota bacterium]
MKEKIITKHEYWWHFAHDYLDAMHVYEKLMNDKEFVKIYSALVKYVDEKISLPSDNDWVDFYVVTEQEA